MPVQIIGAIIALALSCISSLVALYMHEIEGTSFGFSNTYSLVFSIIWVAIILWLIWDVAKNKKDIRLTLVLVSVIMFASTALDFFAGEFYYAFVLEGIELVFWLIAFVFLNLPESKEWYVSNVQ